MRKPLERENGRYKKSLDKLELIAKDTVENICKEYSDIDVIDLQFCFENVLRVEFVKKILEESVDVESR